MSQPVVLPGLDKLEKELMRGIRRHPRLRLRRLLGAVSLVAIAVPVGIAAAGELGGFGAGPISVHPAVVITIGFEDPSTGDPVRCDDGTLLTQTVMGVEARVATSQPGPTCADGSVPEAYRRSEERWKKFLRHAPAGTDLARAPGLRAFVIGSEVTLP